MQATRWLNGNANLAARADFANCGVGFDLYGQNDVIAATTKALARLRLPPPTHATDIYTIAFGLLHDYRMLFWARSEALPEGCNPKGHSTIDKREVPSVLSIACKRSRTQFGIWIKCIRR